jgi:hypothetical protein
MRMASSEGFEIAHLDLQDVKVVVVFLDGIADPQVYARRHYAELKSAAAQAGLDGNIVAVWPDELGRTRFLAPPEQHAFFQIADYDQLRAQINGTLRVS